MTVYTISKEGGESLPFFSAEILDEHMGEALRDATS